MRSAQNLLFVVDATGAPICILLTSPLCSATTGVDSSVQALILFLLMVSGLKNVLLDLAFCARALSITRSVCADVQGS